MIDSTPPHEKTQRIIERAIRQAPKDLTCDMCFWKAPETCRFCRASEKDSRQTP